MTASVRKVCLLGFGEVGVRLAKDLLANTGVELVAWDRLFDQQGSIPNQNLQTLASSQRIRQAKGADEAGIGADLVISAVTAEQDLPAAESVLFGLEPFTWFLDLNSVSPGTKLRVADQVNAVGGRYVEAAVMAPVGPRGIATSMVLSGPNAEEFLAIGTGLGFIGMSVISHKQGQAAASKMCRSVIVKGLEALLTEALLAARHYDVEDEVLRSLDNLLPCPDWRERAQYMISRSLQHGGRRAEEMRQATNTVSEAGVTPWMSQACVERQQWAGNLSCQVHEHDLTTLLDDVRNSPIQEVTN